METLTIKVKNKPFKYPIFIGKNILKKASFLPDLRRCSGVVIIVDEKVKNPWGDLIENSLRKKIAKVKTILVPSGEDSKSLRQAARLYQKLLREGFDRKAVIFALGGGVIGDLAGFVAATYLRGVDFVQIPTSLLAQVDAAIGGKVGINFLKLKNIIGSFYQPKAVIIDIETLSTLPERELKSGMAEIVKYGLCLDKSLLPLLMSKGVSDLNSQSFLKIIKRCVKLKAEVVEKDEKDLNIRAVLNFGHTIGHAIEAKTNIFTHGEAVGIGMRGAAKISNLLGFLSEEEVNYIEKLLLTLDLPISCPSLLPAKLWQAIKSDKKAQKERIKWVLLEKIGRALINQKVEQKIVLKVLKKLCQRKEES